jgi:Tfp pilus assembly protein PilN
MKPINFIKTKNYTEQQAMHRWFWQSCILLISLLICLSIIQIRLFFAYKSAQQELQRLKPIEEQLNSCLTEKRTLKETTKMLKNKLAKTNRIKHKPKNPANLLQTLNQLSSGVVLQNISLNKKQLEVTVLAPQTKQILEYTTILQKNPLFEQVNVGSIEQVNNQIKGLLQIKIK